MARTIPIRRKNPAVSRPLFAAGVLLWLASIACVDCAALPQDPQADTSPRGVVEGQQRIEYLMPEAGSVVLIWGDEYWQPVPESMRPEATELVGALLHTPMTRSRGRFEVVIPVPQNMKLQYGFMITSARNGNTTRLWIARPNFAPTIAALASILFLFLLRRPVLPQLPGSDERSIPYASRFVWRIGRWLAVANMAFIGFTSLTSYALRLVDGDWDAVPSFFQVFLRQLNLGSENVVASWYSSMLFLAVAVVAAGCYLLDRTGDGSAGRRGPDWGWLLLATAFALLSLDELGSMHERIGMIASVMPGESAVGWVRMLAIPIVLCGGAMILFGYLRMREVRLTLWLAVLGTILFLINPILEEIEAATAIAITPASEHWIHDLYHALEEGAEVFGALAWLISLLIYMKASVSPAVIARFRWKEHDLQTTVLLLGVAAIVGLCATEWFVRFTLPGDSGVPRHWFPAALSLLSTVLLWLRYPNRWSLSGDATDDVAPMATRSLAALAVLISLAFGVGLSTVDEGTGGAFVNWSLRTLVAFHVIGVFWVSGSLMEIDRYRVAALAAVAGLFVVEPKLIAIPATAGYVAFLLNQAKERA